MLSLLGNATYGAGVGYLTLGPYKHSRFQILFHSTSSRYVLVNLPWLIGSIGELARAQTVEGEENLLMMSRYHGGEHCYFRAISPLWQQKR